VPTEMMSKRALISKATRVSNFAGSLLVFGQHSTTFQETRPDQKLLRTEIESCFEIGLGSKSLSLRKNPSPPNTCCHFTAFSPTRRNPVAAPVVLSQTFPGALH
jgi:hypothetical protein